MGELSILFGILIILTGIFIGLMFYNDGAFIKNRLGNIAISAFIILITFLTATSFPSNYTMNIVSSTLIGVIGIIGAIVIEFKKDKFNIARILMTSSIIFNLLLLFMI